MLAKAVSALAICAVMNVSTDQAIPASSKPVPAEWEPQESVWLQWPSEFERVFQPAFARMSAIISRYQKLNIVCDSSADLAQATKAIAAAGGDPDHANIDWHELPNDSVWMRDNGPVYLLQDGELRLQNRGFNAWVGAFGKDIPCARDNQLPSLLGERLGIPVEVVDIEVICDPILGQVEYRGRSFDTNYLNRLVGNGFVIAAGLGDDAIDAAAGKRIAGYFPGRDVHIIEMLASWYDGGGVHCHTNDQPAL